jgi:hypothetical protein
MLGTIGWPKKLSNRYAVKAGMTGSSKGIFF